MIVAILVGLAVIGFGAAAWTGRWRRWAAWDGPPVLNGPISLLPAIGVSVVCATLAYDGIAQPLTDAVAAISWVGGLVLYLWHPSWYGPRWYRERRANHEVRLDTAVAANILADVVEGEPARKAGWWSRWGRGRVAGWWRARLLLAEGEQRGTLVLYRTALAFSALDGPNEILFVRNHEFLGTRVEVGALVVDTHGGMLVFGMRRATRAARRIERTLRP